MDSNFLEESVPDMDIDDRRGSTSPGGVPATAPLPSPKRAPSAFHGQSGKGENNNSNTSSGEWNHNAKHGSKESTSSGGELFSAEGDEEKGGGGRKSFSTKKSSPTNFPHRKPFGALNNNNNEDDDKDNNGGVRGGDLDDPRPSIPETEKPKQRDRRKEEKTGGGGRDGGEEEEEEQNARPKVTIDQTKDLWQNISLNVKDGEAETNEVNVLMVGASESGKSTLLQRIYSTFTSATTGGSTSRGKAGSGGTSSKKIKPTTALDYSFARRTDRHQAQVAHFWELAQGTDLSQLADVIVTPENIHAMAIIVVVDASDGGLGKIWETATYWLKRLDRRISEILSRMRAKGSGTPDKLLHRAHRLLGGEENPDLKRMRISGVPTVLVVNKMDAFSKDSTKLKLLGQCLRFLAHLYGAHLIFTGEDETVAKWRLLISHILFQSPFDTRQIQMDPERGNLLVMADRDSFIDIGDPPITNFSSMQRGARSGDGELDRWGAPFDAVFPPKQENALASEDRRQDDFMKKLYDLSEDGYGEPTIDAMRRQKEEELEQYRKAMKAKERGGGRKGAG